MSTLVSLTRNWSRTCQVGLPIPHLKGRKLGCGQARLLQCLWEAAHTPEAVVQQSAGSSRTSSVPERAFISSSASTAFAVRSSCERKLESASQPMSGALSEEGTAAWEHRHKPVHKQRLPSNPRPARYRTHLDGALVHVDDLLLEGPVASTDQEIARVVVSCAHVIRGGGAHDGALLWRPGFATAGHFIATRGKYVIEGKCCVVGLAGYDMPAFPAFAACQPGATPGGWHDEDG